MNTSTHRTSASEAIIREEFGRVVYTHKTHLKAMDVSKLAAILIKWVNISLTAITSGTLLSTLFLNQQLVNITAFTSTLSLGFAIFQLTFNPEKNAELHKGTADKLFLVRERYLSLIADIIDKRLKPDQVAKLRDELINDTSVIYKNAPATGPISYFLAGRGLKINEEFTFTNEEINSFLPAELHR